MLGVEHYYKYTKIYYRSNDLFIGYDIMDGIISFSQSDVISNQQDGVNDPFVKNVRFFQISSEGILTFQIGNYNAEEEIFISTQICKLNGYHPNGTAYFFTASKTKALKCQNFSQ